MQGNQDGNTEEASDAAPGGTEASSGGGSAATTVITHLGDGAGEPDEVATGRRANKRKHDQVDDATPGRAGGRHMSPREHLESLFARVLDHLLDMLEDADCICLWLQMLAPTIEEDVTDFGFGLIMAATFAASDASVRLRIHY